MSIRWKILLTLAATFALFVAMTQIVERTVLRPSFEGNAAALTTQRGIAAMRVAQGEIIAAETCFLLVTWFLLRQLVVMPLLKMTRHVVDVGRNDDLQARLNLRRNDEIGTLGREFDRMVAGVAESRTRMLDVAHDAGKAEIAAEVLHNVGNALNTINASTETLTEKTRGSNIQGLAKALQVIQDNRDQLTAYLTQDPKGQKLVEYLTRLIALLEAEHGEFLQELDILRDKIHHIKEVIAAQQINVGSTPLVQRFDLTKLIDEVVAMYAADMGRHNIVIRREFDPLPPVSVQKSRLMQVLVNLVKNALESMKTKGGPGLCLTVHTQSIEGGRVRLSVQDTGVGIAGADLPRIFTSDLASPSNGRGIELHYCANAIAVMGGSIAASSAGIGCGSVFTIELPLAGVEANV